MLTAPKLRQLNEQNKFILKVPNFLKIVKTKGVNKAKRSTCNNVAIKVIKNLYRNLVVSKLVLSLIYQTNEMIETVKTDLEVANDALVSLVPNITASDKKEAPYTRPTVDTYLKGLGPKLEVAMDLLAFFRSRIDGRRSLIAQAEHETAA